VQQSYKGSLAAGDSRALVTNPLSLNTDSQGRSFIRFVVVSDDGRILAEGGRTVGAAGGAMSQADQNARTADFMKNWEAAIVKAQAETKAFFVSRGEPVPAMGDIATFASRILEGNTTDIPLPDPATTERQMRLAFRALDAAKSSGNAERIALEQARFDRATAEHIASTGFVMVTPGSERVKSVPDIVSSEEATWKTPTGKLERAERELVVVRGELVAAVDQLAEVRIGGVKIDAKEKGNVALEQINKNSAKLFVANGASSVGKVGITMESGTSSEIELRITEDKMVSLGTWGRSLRNVDMTISGENLAASYSSDKREGSGDSVSLKLTAGVYKVKLEDVTNYNDMVHASLKDKPFTSTVDIDVRQYNSADINGLISVEGRSAVMPVSMRVAEFIKDSSGKEIRNENYDGKDIGKKTVDQLDPSKPVWVVVHGRVNTEESSQIAELTMNLKNLGVQVVTLDWGQGAKDNLLPFTLEGSKWIEKVGAWGANQLLANGFTGENINGIGHSWGSYVSYEIGAHIPGGIKTLVALDPASDNHGIGGGQYKGFSDPDFKFSSVAANSYGFHSSFYGSGAKAKTAEYSFDIIAPEGYESGKTFPNPLEKQREAYVQGGLISEIRDELIDDPSREHGFATSLFTSLLVMQKNSPNQELSKLFALSELQNDVQCLDHEGYEGVFTVDPMNYTNEIGTEKGTKTWKANIFGFYGKDKNGNDIVAPRTL